MLILPCWLDIHESKDTNTVTLTFELPGLKKEDVHIEVQNSRLTVSGERTENRELSQDGWVRKERRSGKFARTVILPQGVTPDNIKAGLNDGVLTVTFPKATPEQEARKIAIN